MMHDGISKYILEGKGLEPPKQKLWCKNALGLEWLKEGADMSLLVKRKTLSS